ncbi:conserved hypothetical protein [Solidesulfovibrio fructosivorans JJ]]|uniref:Uncharacterized protein n=1 Tax=Solidesulfovibrio fructosivorans JJ] TaxID=596151 RepID=E1JRB7_SOLFR|nr:hypothetical protein [Solidesulfovibrio fructosivorans]EFL53118.1 conserved hypothetical protein [Solidesulfovibrio fructosivorans JJ]]
MSNALAQLRRVVAPAPRRRAATIVRILAGGRVELAVAADTSGTASTAGATAARPEVYCGVTVSVGDRVLVEGDRVISRLAREAGRAVRIK